MTISKIEWTDRTWNPVTGCARVSPGCDHCYAIGQAHRFHRGTSPLPLTERRDDRVDWTGRVELHDRRLDAPLRWRKPARVFVNSMSDLFHDDVPDEFIARVFAVMAATPQHTYQILTKRHGRMRSFLQDRCRCPSGHGNGVHLKSKIEWASTPHNPDYVSGLEPGIYHRMTWPLPNVWLGVSVEDQKRADLRIPALLDTPAAVRFLSCEPLLGPVDLLGQPDHGCDEVGPAITHDGFEIRTDYGTGIEHDCDHQVGIDWVIVGGESGSGARPMHPGWARQLRDQCTAAGVPFFFKQWGEWTPWRSLLDEMTRPVHVWDDEFGPGGADTRVCRLGKKVAGRELDGRTWDEFPVVPR